MALVMPFMAVGPLSRWREDTTRRWLHELLVPGLGVSVAAIVLAFLGSDGFNVWIALAVLLAGWVALGVVKDLWRRIATGVDGGLTWRRLTPSFLGMALAHLVAQGGHWAFYLPLSEIDPLVRVDRRGYA